MRSIAIAKQLIRLHEGKKLLPYRDTVGKITIGYGRNLSDVGITADEAEMMLENDIYWVVPLLRKAIPSFDLLNEPRQAALIDMAFNLGEPRFMGFKKMIAAINAFDFATAAKEMMDSMWSKQVGQRAKTLAAIIETGAMK